MRITVVGVLIVIAGVLLLALVAGGLGQRVKENGKANDQPSQPA
jgi:hypothetical protein